MDIQVSPAVTLIDKRSFARRRLFRLLSLNSIDGMRFYEFGGRLSQLPVLGAFFTHYLSLYYRYIHTRSVKLPLSDIEAVIRHASQVSVGPCPCRLIREEPCDSPLYTCLRLNSFSESTSEFERRENERGSGRGNALSRVLTKEEALAIVRNARGQGMILQLESCISPYQNNICVCCTCCCVELRLRNILGQRMGPHGPYLPVVDTKSCKGCRTCLEKCPFEAVSFSEEGPLVDPDKCTGCGICAEACPEGSIGMVPDRQRMPVYPEPGPAKTLLILAVVGVTHLFFYLPFRLFTGNRQYLYNAARPRSSDVVVAEGWKGGPSPGLERAGEPGEKGERPA